MKNKTIDNQAVVLSAIKKLEASLRNEIRKGDSALRDEMKIGSRAVRQETLKVEERVENLEEGQMRIETTVNKISSQLDGFVGKVEDLELENIVGTKHYRDHEERIIKLEQRAKAS